MKKLKVKIVDSLTLMLEEAGSIGDLIDLRNINTVDTEVILQKIKEAKDLVYEDLLNKELNQVNNNFNLKLTALENAHNLEVKNLEKALKEQETSLKLTLENQHLQQINKLELQIQNLINEKANVDNKHQLEIERLKANAKVSEVEIVSKYQETLNKLKLENQDEVFKLTTEIDNLKREKTVNVKMIGEDLERWADTKFRENNLMQPSNIKWYKDNLVVAGTKGDFIYEVYSSKEELSDTLLTSALLEMKSEDPNAKNKQNLNTILKKLDSDRNKKQLEYAILVSEIDFNNNDLQIERVLEYDKMFIVRPQYFMTLLNIITAFALKYEEILLAEAKDELKFKDITEILAEFEEMKESILNNQITHIKTHIENISKQNEAIIKASEKISDAIDKIVNSHLKALENKINDFNIKKIVNKIERL